MMTYFPEIYPGELLYSVLARYHRHTGAASPIHTMEALFGRRMVVASVDLQGGLDVLAARIPAGRGLDSDAIISDLTLLPYYAAFHSLRIRRWAWENLKRGSATNLHLRLGMTAFRSGRVTQFRFCPTCLEAMRAQFGECYWRRDQQLPGVLVCPQHGTPLRYSALCLAMRSRHAFVAADEANCHATAPALVPRLSDQAMTTLWRIAKASAALLVRAPAARTPTGWTQYYRGEMQRAGLAAAPTRMRQKELEAGLRAHFGACLRQLPGVMNDDRLAGDWLAGMTRQQRKAADPLHHLLLQDYLRSLPATMPAFGEAPWECRNPLHRPRSKACIRTFTQHRNHDHTVGVFSCRCGYVYTRMLRNGDPTPGPPRFQFFGPLLAPALRRWIEERCSLREIGRRLQLDPKTVVRLSTSLGIDTPWSPKCPSWLHHPCATRRGRQDDTVRESRTRRRITAIPPRRDWQQLDRDLCRSVRDAEQLLRTLRPPARVSSTALERQLGLRGWIGKRRIKLSATTELLGELVEPIDAFRKRRLRWAIDEFEHTGKPLLPSALMRTAGLPAGCKAMVDAVVAQHWRSRRPMR